MESSPKLNIQIKCTSGKKFTISIGANQTIEELKKASVESSGIEWENQRLIYKGRVLKDEDTLEKNNINDGHTIILVKGVNKTNAPNAPVKDPVQQPTANTTTTNQSANTAGSNPFGANPMDFSQLFSSMSQNPANTMNPEFISSMMQNPLTMSMVQSALSNPETMQAMMRTNPMLQNMMQADPNMQNVMSELARNPQLLQSMQTPENIRLASDLCRSMFQANAAPGSAPQTGTNTAPPMDMSQMFGQFAQAMAQQPAYNAPTNTSTPASTTTPTTNSAVPTNTTPNTTPTNPAPPQANVNPEDLYAEQLRQLSGMGFTNWNDNVDALVRTGGNLTAAIDVLISKTSSS